MKPSPSSCLLCSLIESVAQLPAAWVAAWAEIGFYILEAWCPHPSRSPGRGRRGGLFLLCVRTEVAAAPRASPAAKARPASGLHNATAARSARALPRPACLSPPFLRLSLHAFLSLLFPLFHPASPLFFLPSFFYSNPFSSFFPSFLPPFLSGDLAPCFSLAVSGCLGLSLSQALSPDVLLVTVWPRAL